ncbi:diacylglycerol kinase [bacterium]|nr:diacylglycerol kinase [bacterium]
MINFRKLCLSFKRAFEGLKIAILEEQTFRIQVMTGILILFLMIYFPLTILERAILILTVILVLSLELINSQIERILDFLQPNHDPKIKKIKDLSASAVLLASLGSIVIGLLILLPYLLK